MFFYFMKILVFLPLYLLFPTKFYGRKNLPKGKVILISNHKSNADALILVNRIWRVQHVLAKKELFKNKLLGAAFKGMKAIPVDREKVEISTIKQCLRVLKNNKILTIFPEGTRNKGTADLLELKQGANLFALKSAAPIVPVWFSKKPSIFKFNKVTFGEPFYITKDNYETSNAIIREKLLNLKDNNK